MWGESGLYEAKFVISNPKTAFVKTIEIDDNNIGKLVFPDEFNHTRGKFNKDTITLFNWYIEVKNQKVASGKIVYNPSPNELLQLFKYDVINFKKKEVVWGDIVDGFRWCAIRWQHDQGVPYTTYSRAPDEIKHREPGKHEEINNYLERYIRQHELHL